MRRAKYKLIDSKTFTPHIRSNFQAAVPIKILNYFRVDTLKEPVALIKIKSDNSESFRIKKLSKASNSLIISLKAEKALQNPQIEILEIKSAKELQTRTEPIVTNNKLRTISAFPQYTKKCSWPDENQVVSPIYLFPYNSKVYSGIRLSRKDLIFTEELELNELLGATVGLYFAEGGKIAPSFTNSQPKIINTVLNFLEQVSNIKRKDLRATINCNKYQASQEKSLKEFWTVQTGIENFNKLHIGKHVKSSVGILELNLGSKLIKDLMCSLFTTALELESSKIGLIQGILSGDGSPILQHKNYITHHIATDKNHIKFQQEFIRELLQSRISSIKKVNNGKIVLYNNWETNYNFLFLDPYKFNIFNREKFAEQFINLPSTMFFIKLNDNDMINGTDIERRYAKYLVKNKYIKLKQTIPKPNRKYEIFLTNKGVEQQRKLKEFIKNIYSTYIEDIRRFEESLTKFNLGK